MPYDVDPKSINPAPKPEPHYVVYGGPHLRVAPIQVPLFCEKRMVVILSSCAVVFPCAAAEFRAPVVRNATVRRRIAPDVPIALGILTRGPAFDKPRMLI